jgi:hypothetical protein
VEKHEQSEKLYGKKSGAREANKELSERVEFEIFVVRHSSVFSELLLGSFFLRRSSACMGKYFALSAAAAASEGKINLITSGCVGRPVKLGDDWNAPRQRGAQRPADVGHHHRVPVDTSTRCARSS